MPMLMVAFFSWWYGSGWAQVARSFKPRVSSVLNIFSVGQLSKTLFAPWRRIISYSGRSLGDRMRAALDNLVSRVIGFIVRLMVLLAAMITLSVVVILTTVEVLAWPLLPLAIPGCIIAGLLV